MTPLAFERCAMALGFAGMLLSALAWVLVPAAFAHAWLAAVTLCLSWPLGSLGLLFIHALTGGRWGFAIRRPLLAGAATLPVLLLALLPVIVLAPSLYPWLHPQYAAALPNRFYLNMPFACVRLALYASVWIALGAIARHFSRKRDQGEALTRYAPAALILLGISLTFAAIDLTLSLEPRFTSSIYGWMACSEALLLALSVALLLSARLRSAARQDLARLLLALLVLFAYLDFMQLLIIWNSNLPRDALWYAPRLRGDWGLIAGSVALLHFALPFIVLIFPPLQRSNRAVTTVAALLVAMEVLRVWWLVIPAGHRDLSWPDLSAMVAVLPLAAAFALRSLRQDAHLPGPAHG